MSKKKQTTNPVKKMAVKTFNEAWKYLDKNKLRKEEKIILLNLVHTSFYLWQQVPECSATHTSISLWQISRAYAHTGDGINALLFAEQNIKLCKKEKIDGFYTAYAYESAARAFLLLKENKKTSRHISAAMKAIQHTDEKHTEIFFRDMEELENSVSSTT